jgi:hypothetical protein
MKALIQIINLIRIMKIDPKFLCTRFKICIFAKNTTVYDIISSHILKIFKILMRIFCY